MVKDTCNPNIRMHKHEVRVSSSSMIKASSRITGIRETPSLNNNNPIIKHQYAQMDTKIYILSVILKNLEVKIKA